MKIGIDISLVSGNRSGVGVYTYYLVKALARLDWINDYDLYPFFYYIYHPDFKNVDLHLENPHFRYKYQYLPKTWIDYLWQRSGIAKRDIIGDIDILHSTTFCVPEGLACKQVVTIYDVSFYTHPQYHQQANIDHCMKGTIDAVARADKIIAISQSAKDDLIKYFNCPEDKVVVTLLGYDKEVYRPIEKHIALDHVKNKFSLQGPYIFSLGTLEPRKNIDGLIKAYDALPQSYKDVYKLVIAGGKGWLDTDIYKLIAEKGLGKNIVFLGYVDEDDLKFLYSAAECFVFPSHYEGFGLPPLQAFACGCPVITAHNSSLLEVAADAALLVDSQEYMQIKESLEKLLTNVPLQDSLRGKGFIQAEKFSWEKCAQQTLGVYRSLA